MYKTTLAVDGMMCGMCEQHVREAVQKALEERGISAKKITASRKQKEVAVIAEQPVEERLLRSAIQATGYDTGAYQSAPDEKKGLLPEDLLSLRMSSDHGLRGRTDVCVTAS